MQDDPGNSDIDPPADSCGSEKFSAADSGENFIRSNLKRIGTASIDVLLEPALLLEFPDKQHGLVGGPRAELRDDVDQRTFDVLRHPFGVAADIDIGAFGEPAP